MNTTNKHITVFKAFKAGKKLSLAEVNELCIKMGLARTTNKREYDALYYRLYKDRKAKKNKQYAAKNAVAIKSRERERQHWNRSLCGVIGRNGYFPETESWYEYYSRRYAAYRIAF